MTGEFSDGPMFTRWRRLTIVTLIEVCRSFLAQNRQIPGPSRRLLRPPSAVCSEFRRCMSTGDALLVIVLVHAC
jgi:hypothetical protein